MGHLDFTKPDSSVGWKVPVYKARSSPSGTWITAREPVRSSLRSSDGERDFVLATRGLKIRSKGI